MSISGSANRSSEVEGVRAYTKPNLSDREIEVLLAWFCCDTKANVAKRLYISLGTVNTHLARVRHKYESVGRSASTKAALVARALQDGFVCVEDL
ncbi:helix-turn-helix transcriptional regulator [Antrihabitans stalactiti]|uniref:LuxR family transcriptional regulator n=1 Tax=Antrihabitans stalactiti TaxID=2584121 RepID=A0A848KC20_9NOCA|nr:LuxR C-terminal-related transcriptional regulator [Antrihabitans stalactiti]NMN95078.1 LuxR family transcriptional regulator [Antrihabitans stalactiti]